MRRAGLGLLSILWLLLLAGCGSLDEADSGPFTETDGAGVVIAMSRAPAWAEGGGWEISEEPVAVIGRSAGDPDDQHFRVRGLARLGDGRISVRTWGSESKRGRESSTPRHEVCPMTVP